MKDSEIGSCGRDKNGENRLVATPPLLLIPTVAIAQPQSISAGPPWLKPADLYQSPLIVDVESFNKVAKDVEILVACFSDLLLDAISALTQYA